MLASSLTLFLLTDGLKPLHRRGGYQLTTPSIG